jgi:hypothetical protein
MTEEEKQGLWRSLQKLDRKISSVGSIAIGIFAWTFGWVGYFVLPDTWGISKGLAAFVDRQNINLC